MKSQLEDLILKLERTEEMHIDSMTICYMLMSSFCLSMQGFLSKSIQVNSSQIVYYRGLVMMLMNTVPLQFMGIQVYDYPREVLKKIYGRCILGCIGTLLFYQALKYISVSDGLVLFRTTPIWTSLLAVYYLKKETFNARLVQIMIISFIGIIMIIQPSFLLKLLGQVQEEAPNHALGVGLMILVAILNSITQVLINQMAGELSQLVILQYFSVVSMVVILFANMIYTYDYPLIEGMELIYLILIGILSYFTQLLMNRAYMKGELTRLTLVGQSQILFAVFFDFLAGHSFNELSLFGGALVIGSLVYLIISKKKK